MATFVFDGSQSLTIPNFDVDADRIVFDDLEVSDIATIVDSPNGATINTTSGTSLVFAGLTLAQLSGLDSLPADFIIVGTNGANDIDINANENGAVVVALGGNDTVAGAGSLDDLIFGNTGNDTLIGNGGSDRIYGGQGNDIIALTGIDAAANPTIDVDAVQSLAVGGLGSDTIVVAGATAGPDTAATPTGFFTGSVTVFGGNEAGDPTDSADNISVSLAGDASALIFGNGGNDTITLDVDATEGDEASGVFAVFGGQGADTITGDVGAGSVIYGGLAADVITINAIDSVSVFGGNGSADAVDGADRISVSLTASDEDAVLSATIFGNGGNDIIAFNANDAVGGAQVAIFGGQGTDVIQAADVGADSQIYGGLGLDQIVAEVVGENVSIFGGNGAADAADGTDFIQVNLVSDVAVAPVEPLPEDNGEDNGEPEIGVAAVAAEGETASVSIFGNAGDDLIFVTGNGNASVFGGAGNDNISVDVLGNTTADGLGGTVVLTGGLGSDTFSIEGSGNGEDETLVSITDFDFDEDFIVGTANNVVQVSGVVNEFADLRALADNNNGADGQTAVLVTVASGDFAGSYLAYGGDEGEIVNITGFTGSVDADVFTTGGIFGV